jgi:glycosyltransferase involved in cell wall biosynthesis
MNVLILTNFGMGLVKFRKELLETLLSQGHTLSVSFPDDSYSNEIRQMGIAFFETKVDRRGMNPLRDLSLVFSYFRLVTKIKPDMVLTYTIKPNIYGGTVCRFLRVPYLATITGLGTTFEKERLLKKVLTFLYRIGLKRARNVFFQNEENLTFFIANHVLSRHTKYEMVKGSGVNLNTYAFVPYPADADAMRFLYIGRIMKSKGIDEYIACAKTLKRKHANLVFEIIGFCEEDYQGILEVLHQQSVVVYHGVQYDVKPFIAQAHAIIQPSYSEGTSNVLLESLSMGRPVIASRIAGCMETFDEGISGLSFEPKNVDDLVKTVERFIQISHEDKARMGIAGRRKMENEYNRDEIVSRYMHHITNQGEKYGSVQ